MSRNRGNGMTALFGVVVAIIALIAIGLGIASSIAPASADATTECVVTDKDRTTDRDGNSNMRIYTENCGTLVVKDNFLKGFFNSADVYSSIEVGKTYNFDATGFRIGFLSHFPKIYKATEVR